MKQNSGLLLAIALPFALAPLLGFNIGNNTNNIEFYILWLVLMLLTALPLLILENALAIRNKQSPIAALSTLTREADAKTYWRITAWLATAVISLIAGLLLYRIAMYSALIQIVQSNSTLPQQLGWLPFYYLAGLAGTVIALSFWSKRIKAILFISALLLFAGNILILTQIPTPAFNMAALSTSDFFQALSFALLANGIGIGLYWFASASNANANQPKSALLLIQLVAGSLVLRTVSNQSIIFNIEETLNIAPYTTLPFILIIAGQALFVAYLLHTIRCWLLQKGLNSAIQWIWILGGLAIGLLPYPYILQNTIMLILLCSTLGYAVFAGWVMKSSHLRKAIGFNSELTYNLWRVAIRLIVPLLALLAIINILMHWS